METDKMEVKAEAKMTYAEKMAEWRKRHKELGLCTSCNEPVAVDGRTGKKLTLCDKHLVEARERMRLRRKSKVRLTEYPSYNLTGQTEE